MKILIKNGKVATHQKVGQIDILIKDQKIIKTGRKLRDCEAKVVNATGLIILPGLIDVHVHLREPGATQKEDFYTGTGAALAGGVTTIIDMPNNNPTISSKKALLDKKKMVSSKAVCDYAFYFGATANNQKEAAKVSKDVVGLKIYMGSSTGDLLVADLKALWEHFQVFPQDKIIAIHGEDEEAIQVYKNTFLKNHNLNRPPICAALALSKAIALAKLTGHRLHVCHVSTAWEIELIKAAKKEGVKISCEVTPHHLFLTEKDSFKLGNFGKMNPPLRKKADVRALWQNLNIIDNIATDHAPHTKEEKKVVYRQAPSGVPGLETMLPLLLTAYWQKKISLSEIVRLTSYSPSHNFGFRQKGEIQVGNDADLVLADLKKRYKIENGKLKTKCGWSPFNGWKVKGKLEKVFLRGNLVFNHDQILVDQGFGKEMIF